ncbi:MULTISPECIES: roadblock/LC7 domain-containing protein [unclassified Streptomyces]|uniref:roadblock/LC7 domain-containing protein n=1 Tax=unclassified Streptomyces TaxID=2593676 RepID=UPI00278C3B1A|nr:MULTISPECIES: roadblock/LC7 domain-containing protein [unclassified Streptomyces]
MTDRNELGWLLDGELGGIEGVKHAVLMSSDGLLKAHTETVERDEAEKFAAITAALRAAAKAFDSETGGGGTRQILIESANNLGMVTQAADNTMLAVLTTDAMVDVGLIAHHMERLATRVGRELATAPRESVTDGVPAT